MNSIRDNASDPERNMFTSGRTLTDLSPALVRMIDQAVEQYTAGDFDTADEMGRAIGGLICVPRDTDEENRPVTADEWFQAVARHVIESAAVI